MEKITPPQQLLYAEDFSRGGMNVDCFDANLEQSVYRRFEAVARRYPNRTAIEFESGGMSYAELNSNADQIARLSKQTAVPRAISSAFVYPTVQVSSRSCWGFGKRKELSRYSILCLPGIGLPPLSLTPRRGGFTLAKLQILSESLVRPI